MMNLRCEEIKGIFLFVRKGNQEEECFYGYDAKNHLSLDQTGVNSSPSISKTKYRNFISRLLPLMTEWDYEYANPLGDEQFYFHIEIESFDGYHVHFEGTDAMPDNYYEVCQLIYRYTHFSMWCGNDCLALYRDFIKIKPLYQLMEFFQSNQVDEHFTEVCQLIEKSKILLPDWEKILQQAGLFADGITIYDIENGNRILIRAIFTYYFQKNYLAPGSIIKQVEIDKLLQCCYKLLELSFFQE